MLIDTHAHLDGEEFRSDLDEVITRAKAAGVGKIFIPGIDISSVDSVLSVCNRYPGYCYSMLGLHPEEVRADWRDILAQLKPHLSSDLSKATGKATGRPVSGNGRDSGDPLPIAIGEIGLDFYWDVTYRAEQLRAFELQLGWAAEYHLPVVIHQRAAFADVEEQIKKAQDKEKK